MESSDLDAFFAREAAEEVVAEVVEEMAAEEPAQEAVAEEQSSQEDLDAIAEAERAAFLAVLERLEQEDAAAATAEETTTTEETSDAAEEQAAPEEEGTSEISAALFDLTAEEVAILKAMEDEIVAEEEAIAEEAEASGDAATIEAAIKEIAELEGEREQIVAEEEAVIAEAEEEAAMEAALDEDSPAVENADENTVEGLSQKDLATLKVLCKDTCDEYVAMISELTVSLDEAKDLINRMADSLAEIDPNTENGAEGKALIRKMYKLRGEKPQDTTPLMPETPEDCVGLVAGKVLQVEELTEDLDKAVSLRDFFSEVYCAAYVNSLVTMRDGLSQIFPGGLDISIESELQRVYGPFEADQLDMIEIAAIEAYLDAIQNALFVPSDSTLIPAVTPLADALSLCDSAIEGEITKAKQDREDYLNDYNFLNYLKTL